MTGTLLIGPVEYDMAYTRAHFMCRICHRRKATAEIEGRVLACDDCASDPVLREHARKDWR